MSTPAWYDVEIRHVRADPVRHDVRHRSWMWFVDVDELPRLPVGLRWLARVDPLDHLSADATPVRTKLEALLAGEGIQLGGGPITMLSGVRSLGYAFDPLTLYWCHRVDGELACVVAEVRNTYGSRHCYVLRPDDAGRAEVAKAFYVSPFFPVDGYYRLSVPEPAERLAVSVTLHRPGQAPFTATVRGTRTSTGRGFAAAALRRPAEALRVRTLITGHGIALWRKGLPVVARPTSEEHMPLTTGVAPRLAELFTRVAGVPLPVRIRAWDGSTAGPRDGVTVELRSRRALRRMLWSPGELGLARAYVSGDLDVHGPGTPAHALATGLRAAWAQAQERPANPARSRHSMLRLSASALGSAARLGALGPAPRPPAAEARLTGRLHTVRRDQAAIAHHYDLSNEFYSLLLDETMAYSCAYFAGEAGERDDLAAAQRAKLDLIADKLGLRPGARLLDVGCGWGSLVLHAAERYGVQATGITLSAQQRDYVAKQVAERGLSHLVTVRLQDYRDLAATGETFDAVASIEMGEHVGEQHYATYAAILHGALRPGGRLLLQQMSRRADAAPGGGAFIESYIAPDMHMRPLPNTLAFLEGAGLEIRHVESLREHYVRTVQHWIDTFESRYDDFVALVGEQVARVWRLYLVGGALSFEQGRMGVDQILAVRR